ncbi:MAG: esterase/lipase family protein, partial [Armatimonadaceae bacterium]
MGRVVLRLMTPCVIAVGTLLGCQLAAPRHDPAPVPRASDLDTLFRGEPRADEEPASSAYQRALSRLVTAALRSGRLHPQRGLTVETPGGEVVIPVRYVGTTWHPDEVDELQTTDCVSVRKHLKHHHTRCGWGVPVVGVSRDAGLRGAAEKFTNAFPHSITLTAVFRPTPRPVLELVDATHHQTVDLGGAERPLAADLSAPLAYAAQRARQLAAEEDRPDVEFFKPNLDADYNRLTGVEPYRPGTFPLVLIHGANSDNFTWLDTLNDLRTDPELVRRFQVMTFRYATGLAYPEATADLRDLGDEFVRVSDPAGADPALRHWVLIGYSLGGPVARLAVSSSGTAMWDAFSATPFERMTLTARTRARLARLFFFEPMPQVKTCVLIASPNDGGTPVSNTLFRLGAKFIRYPKETEEAYRQLLADNPTAIRREARARIPTSLDTISRDNWLIDAARGLPVPADLRLHTIIGDGWMFGASDRV